MLSRWHIYTNITVTFYTGQWSSSDSSTSILVLPFLTLVLPFQCHSPGSSTSILVPPLPTLASSLPTLILSFQCHSEVSSDFIQQLYYLLMKFNSDIYFHTFFPFYSHPSLSLLLSVDGGTSPKRGKYIRIPASAFAALSSFIQLLIWVSVRVSIQFLISYIIYFLNQPFNLSLDSFLALVLILFDFILTFHFNSCFTFQLASIFNLTPVSTTFYFNQLLSPATFTLFILLQVILSNFNTWLIFRGPLNAQIEKSEKSKLVFSE
jgi:hypothetical protein